MIPFSSPFLTAAHCLNVTSLAIWSARLSPSVPNKQALNYKTFRESIVSVSVLYL